MGDVEQPTRQAVSGGTRLQFVPVVAEQQPREASRGVLAGRVLAGRVLAGRVLRRKRLCNQCMPVWVIIARVDF